RGRDDELREAGELLGSPQDPLSGARRAAEQMQSASKGARDAQQRQLGEEADRIAGEAAEVGGLPVVTAQAPVADQRLLLDLANRIQSKLGEAAVVLGGADDGKVGLVVL